MQNNKLFFGRIEVICGSMFSGKTEELIRRLNRSLLSKKNVEIFKPSKDNRYSEEYVVSHNGSKIKSISVSDPEKIIEYSKDIDVIGIDEAQFFDDSIIDICNQLANKNKRVIIAGLDMDYSGKPFGIMPQLMAIAEDVTKLHAICMKCGEEAIFSKRLIQNDDLFYLGEKNEYEPRCRRCNIF